MAERILIADDDDALRESLELVLAAEGYEVASARDGVELLPEILRRLPGVTVVLMSAYGSAELAVEALRRGAYDYLAKPFQPAELLLALRKARERERLRRSSALLRRDVERAVGERPIVAASPGMISVLEVIERAAEFK